MRVSIDKLQLPDDSHHSLSFAISSHIRPFCGCENCLLNSLLVCISSLILPSILVRLTTVIVVMYAIDDVATEKLRGRS